MTVTRHQPRAKQILGQLEQADRDREHDRGQCRRGIQADQAPQSVGDGRGKATDRISRYHQAANVGAVVSRVPAQDQVAKPAYQEDADDRRKSNAEQIDAVIMRREQPRENEHAQQPQQRREDIGGQIDAGLSDQHSATSPRQVLWWRARRAGGRAFSSIAARMACNRRPGKGRDRESDIFAVGAAEQLGSIHAG